MRFGIPQSIVSALFIWIAVAQAQETELADGFKVMDRLVGNWRTEVTDKPSKFVPNGGKFADIESTSPTLKGRFIILHGAEDKGYPLTTVAKVVDELRANAKDFLVEIYSKTEHGFSTPKNKDEERSNTRSIATAAAQMKELFGM